MPRPPGRPAAGPPAVHLRMLRVLSAFVFALVVPAFLSSGAHAQIGSDRYSAMVMDAGSGAVLSAVSPDAPRYPASLTKLMTLYMAFEALRDRRITLESPVPVSAHAAAMEPTKLGLVPGTRLSVEQAVLAMVTLSANDAAAAMGELLGSDEERFGQLMTMRARSLGMAHTTFRNASGLPDPEQVTTAADMALLARHLIQDFPEQYHYFSVPSFSFHGRTIFNHDRMLQTYPGADGLKTGYIEAAGHNLVTSAVHGGVRLIGVVMGAGSNPERDLDMRLRLDEGFQRLDVPTDTTTGHFPNLMSRAEAASLPVRAPAVRLADERIVHKLVPPAPRPGPPRWSVLLGSFASQTAARRAAAMAERNIDGGDVIIARSGRAGAAMWRVEMIGMTQAEATTACAVAARHRARCTIAHGAGGQVASR